MSPAYIRIEPKQSMVVPRYAYWFFNDLYNREIFNKLGEGVRQTLGPEDLLALPFFYPSLDEQKSIVDFLDYEIEKIDALVFEKEKLIELLAEKRKVIISNAVTKGLDENVKMKETGIDGFGEVPEHWLIGPVKRFFTSMDYKRKPLSGEERSYKSGVYPYYGASGIIDYIDEKIFDEDLVLVSEDGANLLNRSSPIAFIATGSYWVNNHAHILKPIDENLCFWSERIESIDLTPHITGSAQPKFTSEALDNLVISAPNTSSEREEISNYVKLESKKYNDLIYSSNRTIELLKERRSALISAAVTGQIDVRNYQPKEDA